MPNPQDRQAEIARLTAKIKERDRLTSRARKDAENFTATGLGDPDATEREAVRTDAATTNERGRRRFLRQQERKAKKKHRPPREGA